LTVAVRRAEILVAAATEFGARPYSEVAVADVAERAGTSEALIYHYFNDKAGLYTELIQQEAAELLWRQQAEIDRLGQYAATRDRVHAALKMYLDVVTERPHPVIAPIAGNDPPAAAELRCRIRADYVNRLRDMLAPGQGFRHMFALWGFFGFLDAALLQWAAEGCPVNQRESLVAAALGALEGALGDWGG